jgi:hypothetical protein
MIAVDIAKLEMEQLDRKIAQLRRAGLMRSEGEKQLLIGLVVVASRVLVSLGSALVSAGERLSGRRTSGWVTTA